MRKLVLLLAASALFAAERVPVGLTQSGRLIEAQLVRASAPEAPTVVLIGGFDKQASEIIRSEADRYEALPAAKRKFRLLAIPNANPEHAVMMFPPTGPAYRSAPESHYLWRWIAQQPADLVLIAGDDPFGLAPALSSNRVAGFGSIPARRIVGTPGILAALKEIPLSEASREWKRRQSRRAAEFARSLEPHYGREFRDAVYVPGMALIARARLGHTDDVRKLVQSFTDGTKDSMAKATASHLSGHLVFAELAERTKDDAYTKLVRRAADAGFHDDGAPKESMPFHNEMSDAVFMGSPILAKAGKLTGEERYFDMALRNFRFIEKLCRRTDGLYRHSPLHESAWGRGNAFPALGLALTLHDLPPDHAAFREMLPAFRELMSTLSRFQDPHTGMWRQVVDVPGSYPEYSSTAMIARSMLIGVRRGWLDEKEYQPRIAAAWNAILARTSEDGQVLDVCESTGKQDSLQKYLDREAIHGKDARGGGMAMMLAVEMSGLQ